MVIFNSDNGGYIGNYAKQQVTDNAPLRSGKGSLYEGGLRVPLMVRWPGVTPQGAVCREPVLSTDLFYTLAEMAGLAKAAPATPDGRSLCPLLADPQAHLARDAVFFHYPHYYHTTSPVSAVRTGDWKLLEYYEDHHRELYNLRTDLSEKTDLLAAHPEKAEAIADRLHAWLREAGAQMPSANPDYKAQPGAGSNNRLLLQDDPKYLFHSLRTSSGSDRHQDSARSASRHSFSLPAEQAHRCSHSEPGIACERPRSAGNCGPSESAAPGSPARSLCRRSG